MEFTISEGPVLVEAHPGDEWEEAKVKLSTLRQKWEALLQQAEQRSAALCLAVIEGGPAGACKSGALTVHDDNKHKYSWSPAVLMNCQLNHSFEGLS